MRKSGGLLIPLTIILFYYGAWVAIVWFLLDIFPGLAVYMPIGGVDELASSNLDSFEPVYTSIERKVLSPAGPVSLLIASIGALILTVPVSWA